MTENKRFNRDNRAPADVKKETFHFRGVSVSEKVQHMFDHTATGRVTKIEIPIVYVQFDGKSTSHPCDRDELLSEQQVHDAEKRRLAKRSRTEVKPDFRKQKKQDRDELPEFEPEVPPGR
jgi:hypothetical protein